MVVGLFEPDAWHHRYVDLLPNLTAPRTPNWDVAPADHHWLVAAQVMEWGWNGVEWDGVEWNGMEWNGMEWNGVEHTPAAPSYDST